MPCAKIFVKDGRIVINYDEWRVACFKVLTQCCTHSAETTNDEVIPQQPNVFFHFSSLQQSLQIRVHQDLTKLNSPVGHNPDATGQIAHDENLGAIGQRRRLTTANGRQQNDALVETVE